MSTKEIDHEYTQDITCPACGWIDRDSWESDDSGEYDCDCGCTFTWEREVTVTYSTQKAGEAE